MRPEPTDTLYQVWPRSGAEDGRWRLKDESDHGGASGWTQCLSASEGTRNRPPVRVQSQPCSRTVETNERLTGISEPLVNSRNNLPSRRIEFSTASPATQ